MYIERHPQRIWTLILQQAWSFHLRDGHSGNNSNRGDGNQSGKSNKKESCCHMTQDVSLNINVQFVVNMVMALIIADGHLEEVEMETTIANLLTIKKTNVSASS